MLFFFVLQSQPVQFQTVLGAKLSFHGMPLEILPACSVSFALNIHACFQLFTILFPTLWDENCCVRVIRNVYGNWAPLFRQLNVMFKRRFVLCS